MLQILNYLGLVCRYDTVQYLFCNHIVLSQLINIWKADRRPGLDIQIYIFFLEIIYTQFANSPAIQLIRNANDYSVEYNWCALFYTKIKLYYEIGSGNHSV